jgi:hypothetical protein
MRIILYTGKGGVGKTSVAAATAVKSARQGFKTLVVSTDAAHSLGDSLDMRLSPEPVEIEKNISFPVVANAIFVKQRPFVEILIPIPELHIKAAIHGLIVHLVVKALAIRHRTSPFWPARRYGHYIRTSPVAHENRCRAEEELARTR